MGYVSRGRAGHGVLDVGRVCIRVAAVHGCERERAGLGEEATGQGVARHSSCVCQVRVEWGERSQ